MDALKKEMEEERKRLYAQLDKEAQEARDPASELPGQDVGFPTPLGHRVGQVPEMLHPALPSAAGWGFRRGSSSGPGSW